MPNGRRYIPASMEWITIIIPVRCFSCGALIGYKREEFVRRVKEGEDSGRVLDSLDVNAIVAAAC